MILLANIVIILFGLFLIAVGMLMWFRPETARAFVRKAGSTNLINYGELIIRMIPAAAMVMASHTSRFPELFSLLGWFMIGTSIALMMLPKTWHHSYALWAADKLSPSILKVSAPFSLIFGAVLIYGVL
jgi:hypothetical protein